MQKFISELQDLVQDCLQWTKKTGYLQADALSRHCCARISALFNDVDASANSTSSNTLRELFDSFDVSELVKLSEMLATQRFVLSDANKSCTKVMFMNMTYACTSLIGDVQAVCESVHAMTNFCPKSYPCLESYSGVECIHVCFNAATAAAVDQPWHREGDSVRSSWHPCGRSKKQGSFSRRMMSRPRNKTQSTRSCRASTL